MGYAMRGLASGKAVWLLVIAMLAFLGCSSARKAPAPEPVPPIFLFSCSDVAVPPFAWMAPEDTVYIEREKEKGRDVPSHSVSAGADLASRMALCLKEKGVSATAVAVNGEGGLQEQVDALKEQGYACVLLGRVERYEERIGSDWSVNRPASVAFKILLMDTATGRVVWKGAFDEAQQPLSENLFTLKRFVKRKARWVTAGDLAETGFRGLVSSMVRVGGRLSPVDEVAEEQ